MPRPENVVDGTPNPLVSIIIPTYNPGPFLEKTISSISGQEYERIEIIVVDDCSAAHNFAKIQELSTKYQLRVLRLEKNSGSCAKPLNIGIQIASGEYIAICAQDDYFLPHKTRTQVDFLRSHTNFCMAFSDTYTVFGDVDANRTVQKTPKRRSGQIFDDLILQRFYIPALTVMIRRDIFDTIGDFDETMLIEDWDMWLRIANAFNIGYIDERLACYRIHDGSASKVYSKRMIQDRLRILSKWKNSARYFSAIHVANFLDASPNAPISIFAICDAVISLISLGQPFRWISVFISKFGIGRRLKNFLKSRFAERIHTTSR